MRREIAAILFARQVALALLIEYRAPKSVLDNDLLLFDWTWYVALALLVEDRAPKFVLDNDLLLFDWTWYVALALLIEYRAFKFILDHNPLLLLGGLLAWYCRAGGERLGWRDDRQEEPDKRCEQQQLHKNTPSFLFGSLIGLHSNLNKA